MFGKFDAHEALCFMVPETGGSGPRMGSIWQHSENVLV